MDLDDTIKVWPHLYRNETASWFYLLQRESEPALIFDRMNGQFLPLQKNKIITKAVAPPLFFILLFPFWFWLFSCSSSSVFHYLCGKARF